MDNFNDTYWTVAQTLAWVIKRDRERVCNLGDSGASAKVVLGDARGCFLENDYETESNSKDDTPRFRKQLLRDRLDGAGKPLPLPPGPVAVALNNLWSKTESGDLPISGEGPGTGLRKILDPLQLAGMCFFFDVGKHGDIIAPRRPGATPRLNPNPDLPWWNNLKFRRDEVLAVWPAQATEAVVDEVQTTDLRNSPQKKQAQWRKLKPETRAMYSRWASRVPNAKTKFHEQNGRNPGPDELTHQIAIAEAAGGPGKPNASTIRRRLTEYWPNWHAGI